MENNNQENMKPTIVGVRPPETKINIGERPIGIELLLKKAKVDKEFKEILIRDRSRVSQLILLELDPDEAAILDNIPEEQLIKMIDNIDVPKEQVFAFKKYVAAAMITAMGLTPVFVNGCMGKRNPACPLPGFSATLTATATNSFIPSATNTHTRTQTSQPTEVYTATATLTTTVNPSQTNTPTFTYTNTAVGILTGTPTRTPTPTITVTRTRTPTFTFTDTCVGNTATATPTRTRTPTPTPTNTNTATPTNTP